MQKTFCYLLSLETAVVEAGKMRLAETVPGESGEVCVSAPCRDGKTVARDRLSVVRPAISKEQEAALIGVLRGIIEEEGEQGV